MRRRTLLSAAVLALTVAASGCSGGTDEPAAATPEEQLTTARTIFDDADAVTIALTSTGVPSEQNGVRSATGTGVIDGDTIKFAGDFEGRVAGISATVGIICIGADAYMKMFTPDYTPVDLDDLGAPNPTTFFAPETGIASLLDATTDVAPGGRLREGREILHEVTGTLPGEKVEALLRLGGPGRTFDVTYGLTDTNELRTAVVKGEFFDGVESTYRLLLTDYGKTMPIDTPATGTATELPTESPTG
ncbi:MAG TPA: LppX_LprAFG lipoprotein [Intrasporangiaceae bacterium]|nr:LppX_LprAFG lipoprotein [Intrasporangiaceae bacterium]